ncbi:MAG: tryptophan synthase subunit alpha [Pseudomonadales bacterium]|nr:tryptophan synthase subunit alpha [Pseudomonadales bacterium]MCP5183971.1 tryptophan synthase subunit alpha [Pseudomonadales bacterium]
MSRSTRLSRRMASLGGRKALAAFITAGDPHIDYTVPAMRALVTGGADIIELGVPFSDPEADGPAIQAASERALAAGTRFQDVLDAVARFRETDDSTPIVLMGYLNTVLAQKAFAERAQHAGVDGLIMVNLPPEEAEEFRRDHAGQALDLVFLVAPTTSEERIATIASQASGFLYYVSFKGITGADRLSVEDVAAKLALIRRKTDLPVVVGFGVKDGETARQVVTVADGVAVGTALVRVMAETTGGVDAVTAALTARVAEFREAMGH